MGEMMNDTPKLQISKVYLKERVFKTWYHGRTVLIGDGKGWEGLVIVVLFCALLELAERSVECSRYL